MPGTSELAIFGGAKAVLGDPRDIFTWPVVTDEDEAAVLDVLRTGRMSYTDVTVEFEKDFAAWQGRRYALAFSTGTASIQGAMYGCGLGVGDEIIAPSLTYWATVLQCFSLGATVVFGEVDPETLCLDPADIEHRITARTKAIVVVHYLGYPADMDPIMAIAAKNGLKVIEDVSHAQGGLYKGRTVGTIGHVSGISLMTAKSFPIGEGGMLVTDDVEIYERALAFGHYGRYGPDIETESLRPFAGLPLGGYKYRMHQLSSAMGRVQIKYYDERAAEMRRAMNHFWDLLDGVPGLKAHRTPTDSDSTMGGWHAPAGFYDSEALGGLSITRYCEAVRAEGCDWCISGTYKPLHLHPLFNDCDVYGHGKPTRIAHSDRDLRQPKGSLPVTEGVASRMYGVRSFKKFYPDIIGEYANGYRKAAENYKELLKDDPGDPAGLGTWPVCMEGARDED